MDRVDGALALSRAIGDLEFKDCKDKSAKEQAVTVFPDVTSRTRNADDKFIIIACDGIWDCLDNQECVDALSKNMNSKTNFNQMENEKDFSIPIEELFCDIIAPDTTGDGIGTDNMTAIIIYFTENIKDLGLE